MVIARGLTENLMWLRGGDKEMAKETSNKIHDDEYSMDVTTVSGIFGS